MAEFRTSKEKKMSPLQLKIKKFEFGYIAQN